MFQLILLIASCLIFGFTFGVLFHKLLMIVAYELSEREIACPMLCTFCGWSGHPPCHNCHMYEFYSNLDRKLLDEYAKKRGYSPAELFNMHYKDEDPMKAAKEMRRRCIWSRSKKRTEAHQTISIEGPGTNKRRIH